MDIEGGEIPWLKSLSHEQLDKFEQIVMEFHFPFYDNEKDIFKKINHTHYLVHFHPNNNAGVIYYKNIIIPNVFECTYLHKKYFSEEPELNEENIPTRLDMINDIYHKDIFIDYPPFVN